MERTDVLLPDLLPDPRLKPMVSLTVACRALDMGKSKAYELIAAGRFPVEVERQGGVWKVRTAHLRHYLGLNEPA